MSRFLENFKKLTEEKNSILCIGLDPALPDQRNDNVIPRRYLEETDENIARLNFCLNIIDNVADNAAAIKINEQYIFGMQKEQHQKLTDFIKKKRLFSIYDCKLGDIEESAASKIYWINEAGYDALTVYAQPGNLKKMVDIAHQYTPPIGIIAITLMSNAEAQKYFKESKFGPTPLCYEIAKDVKSCNADGCVVGATEHVTPNDIEKIRKTIGVEKIILFPGIGSQSGDAEKAIKYGGKNIIINVGRRIIYSENPSKAAEEYNKKFNQIRKD